MDFEKTKIDGVSIIRYKAFRDHRGSFKRLFCVDALGDVLDGRTVVQINQSSNAEVGTVRGMHLQTAPHAEMKIIQCIKGAVLDVAVDLRKRSDTFLDYVAVEMREGDDQAIIIPEGFAHGFQVLEPDSHLLYFHTCAYAPDAGMTINPMDPKVGIKWPVPVTNLSDKDKNADMIDDAFEGLTI